MRRVLIVYHSATGGTRAMAQAAWEGGREAEGVAVLLRTAAAAGPADMLAADGYLFAAPENLASLAGVMKDFFDRCYYPVLDQVAGRPYAAMVCAGSDGAGAARQIARIATGWRLRAVAAPLIVVTGAQTPEAIMAPKAIAAGELARCRELGAGLAAGVGLGVF